MMSPKYLIVKAIAKQRKLKPKELIEYCLAAEIRIFALVIAKELRKQIVSEISTKLATETVFIDHEYLAIPPTSLKDYIGISKGDGRSPTIPFLTDLNIKNTLLLPLDKEGKDYENKFSEYKLYIKANDIKTLDNFISANEPTSDDKDINNQTTIEEDVSLSSSKDGGKRFSPEMQKIANEMAAKFMKENNGKRPQKKTIVYMMSLDYPNLGTCETIERRINKEWG